MQNYIRNLQKEINIDNFYELIEEQINQPTDFFNWEKEKKDLKEKNKEKTLISDIIKNLKLNKKEKSKEATTEKSYKIILLDTKIFHPLEFLIKNLKKNLQLEEISTDELSSQRNKYLLLNLNFSDFFQTENFKEFLMKLKDFIVSNKSNKILLYSTDVCNLEFELIEKFRKYLKEFFDGSFLRNFADDEEDFIKRNFLVYRYFVLFILELIAFV